MLHLGDCLLELVLQVLDDERLLLVQGVLERLLLLQLLHLAGELSIRLEGAIQLQLRLLDLDSDLLQLPLEKTDLLS